MNTSHTKSSPGFTAWALMPIGAAIALAVGGVLYGMAEMPLSGFFVWAAMTLAAVVVGSITLRQRGVAAQLSAQQASEEIHSTREALARAQADQSDKSHVVDLEGHVAAINRSQAVIEFDLDGTIRHANENFLAAVGYQLDEIVGQHHRIFVDPSESSTPEYAALWQRLGRGEFDAGQYKRIGKGGKEIWIQASYNPVLDSEGRPVKVVKFATDITAQKVLTADYEGQLNAIRKSQAVIEFDLDGTIRHANDNFLDALGYSLGEVAGQHHRMFVDPEESASSEYAEFWQKLGRGEYDAGQYKRIGKGGKEIWIQASYNPIFDVEGRPVKVVKYATDVTAQVKANAAVEEAVEQTGKVVSAASAGDLSQRIDTSNSDGPMLALCQGINQMLDDIAAGQEREAVVAQDNLRIKNALDNVTTNVMIADNDRQIIYLNESVEQMMREAESDIQKDLPNFKVDALRGGNIDVFHKNPNHQIKMLEALSEAYRTEIVVGGRTFGLIASPVMDADGTRLGTVVEWKDRTAELQLERQLEEKAEQERIVARDNLRIKNALDNVTTNVMIADNDRQIIYLNESVEQMMREAESDIQKDLPGFKVDALRGGNIDVFHKNPDHQIKMLEALKQPHRTEILVGGRTFGLIASPVIDADGSRLGTVVEWKDRTAELKLERELEAKAEREREVAAENLQIRNALDNVSGNVMIANAGRTITYMNKAVEEMMRGNQEELRKVLPSFSVDNLLNGSIDQFHKNPAHQAGLLENLRDTYRTQIQVGPLHFGLVASPIITEDGEHRGTVVEWIDRTAEVGVENEIGEIVAASTRGEFDGRVSLDGKTGFFESLATGINQLLDTCEVGFTDVIRVLGSLAQGDLTQRIEADYQGTFADLKTNVNETIDSLTDMVVAIKAASDDINSAAGDISAGSDDLSSRTEEQAASLEETASSMEELTSTVKQNADNAKQANQLAIGASDVASKGGVVVGDVVTRMSEITESSKKIEDIISVIEGIAFQTNILALNAAVEAARAGEQGRGFAVVASEVRSLAQRSSGAAKEIKQLISDSVERIEDGSKLVGQAGSTMEEIVNSVKRVTDIMAEISAASQEQSSGIEQVNQTIAQMDDATQQNAALVEESSASARSMMDQGAQLNQQVSRFRLDEAMETADPIIMERPARAAAPAARPAAAKARASAPAARAERKPVNVPPSAKGEDNENWSEF